MDELVKMMGILTTETREGFKQVNERLAKIEARVDKIERTAQEGFAISQQAFKELNQDISDINDRINAHSALHGRQMTDIMMLNNKINRHMN
jgi:predicted  nucleic acid-binding Zn-ribbon protein